MQLTNKRLSFFLLLGGICIIVLVYPYCSDKYSEKNITRTTLETILGSKVNLTDSMYVGRNGEYFSMESATFPLMVEYYDNDDCAECTEEGFMELRDMLHEIDTTQFQFVLILHLESGNYDDYLEMIDSVSLNCNCYMDIDGRFMAENPIFNNVDKFYYSFLLNPDRVIEVAGVPIYNQKLWELYKTRINVLNTTIHN